MLRVLAVDDDLTFLKSVKKILELNLYNVTTCDNSSEVVELIDRQPFDIIFLDVKMPGPSGLDLLDLIRTKSLTIPVVFISGQSKIQTAVQALKSGAYDFIEKPVDSNRLITILKNLEKNHLLIQEKNRYYQELAENYRMIGNSSALNSVFKMIDTVSKTNSKVLITGESGTGKELIAWAVHHASDRRSMPYIKVNCAAIPAELLESELFGHTRGSFTGAFKDQKGKFLAADGGSIFLDEIGDMPLQMQAKLLRVLQEGEIEIIGDSLPKKVDIRIIAATNRKLETLISEGKFRKDLYHRLNVININIPPLRDRVDDIMPLTYHFITHYNDCHNKQIQKVDIQAEAVLKQYHWPGNVRELRNVIERLIIFSESDVIAIDDVRAILTREIPNASWQQIFEHSTITPLHQAHDLFEKEYLKHTLNKMNGKKAVAAQALGIDRSHLYKKMKKHNL